MYKINSRKIIVIAGPTASGKSDLAISLAKCFNGEVISADSRQVYRGMDIGAGKVTKAQQKIVRHWLLDVASPKRQYTVAQYKKAATRAITNISHRGKLPIICGGTGFYIDSLVYGLTLPDVRPDAKLRTQLKRLSPLELFALLKKLDPRRAATIDPYNSVRLIRALEIAIKTGRPVAKSIKISSYQILYLAIEVPKNKLAKLITHRLEARLKAGMIKEVFRLHANGLSWKRLESFGLEYRWTAKFLQHKLSRAQMREGILRDSIKYSKRQLTWLRHNKNIIWINNYAKASSLIAPFLTN